MDIVLWPVNGGPGSMFYADCLFCLLLLIVLWIIISQ